MSKHTPGPWKTLGASVYFDGGGFSLEMCPNAVANAELCAAAPDLLEALEGLYELVCTIDCNIPDPKYIRVTQAAAAIAKALGEK